MRGIDLDKIIDKFDEIREEIDRLLPKSKKKKTIPRKSKMKRKHTRKKLKELRPKNIIDIEHLGAIARWGLEIGIVCLLAFVFVWYFGQRISTVGDSMTPVVENGDVVLVDRFVYNISSPKRGDVIVFKPKGNENSHYYIKRIVGLPGETIEIIEGSVYIDGEKFVEDYDTTEITDVGIVNQKIKLAGDEYFVLGDNRSKSEDSRMADVGNVKRDYIFGKAWFVVSPLSDFGFLKN